MGMFTISSGMPLNPQSGIKDFDPYRLAEKFRGNYIQSLTVVLKKKTYVVVKTVKTKFRCKTILQLYFSMLSVLPSDPLNKHICECYFILWNHATLQKGEPLLKYNFMEQLCMHKYI